MPEKEYIDRKAIPLKKFIQTAQMFADDIACAVGTDWMEKIAEAENKKLFEIIKAIQEAPTADVAEVVRCKDCKHWETDKDYSQKPWCSHWTLDSTLLYTKSTDFCSYGERKNDD